MIKSVAAFMRESSVQLKVVTMTSVTSLIIIAVNLILFFFINRSIGYINRVYDTNVTVGQLSESLDLAQSSMREYLNTKSTESIESYFDACQEYRDCLSDLLLIGGGDNEAVLQDIEGLSETWLTVSEDTVQAKRGRVVDRYNAGYERATEIYGFINSYIYSLNNGLFKRNSEKYSALTDTMRSLELITMGVIIAVAFVNILLIFFMTGNIMDPVRQREIMMETHLKDAELRYLQAQINPHFLFNTLNAGAQLAMLEEADRTGDYLQNVAAFFRYRIKGEGKEATLAQEVALVDNYMYILNVRFSGEIHYEKEIDESALEVTIPGMILQPLVENAVNHGIRNIEREKKIRLEVSRDAEYVCVKIIDNGVGMSEERIREVLEGTTGADPEKKDSNGVGITNVIARLRLFYGREDVLRIISGGPDKGTTVEILIPEGEEE